MLVRSNRVHETKSVPSSLRQLSQLVDRRLAIAQAGLQELRKQLAAGQMEEAETLREKLDEDLHLLRCRLRREVETAAPRSPALWGCN